MGTFGKVHSVECEQTNTKKMELSTMVGPQLLLNGKIAVRKKQKTVEVNADPRHLKTEEAIFFFFQNFAAFRKSRNGHLNANADISAISIF